MGTEDDIMNIIVFISVLVEDDNNNGKAMWWIRVHCATMEQTLKKDKL